MSTTFGIIRLNVKVRTDEFGILQTEISEDDIVEVAFRSSNGIRWTMTSILLDYLPDEVKVFPLDNSAQGIYTIGDLRRQMRSYSIKDFI